MNPFYCKFCSIFNNSKVLYTKLKCEISERTYEVQLYPSINITSIYGIIETIDPLTNICCENTHHIVDLNFILNVTPFNIEKKLKTVLVFS